MLIKREVLRENNEQNVLQAEDNADVRWCERTNQKVWVHGEDITMLFDDFGS